MKPTRNAAGPFQSFDTTPRGRSVITYLIDADDTALVESLGFYKQSCTGAAILLAVSHGARRVAHRLPMVAFSRRMVVRLTAGCERDFGQRVLCGVLDQP